MVVHNCCSSCSVDDAFWSLDGTTDPGTDIKVREGTDVKMMILGSGDCEGLPIDLQYWDVEGGPDRVLSNPADYNLPAGVYSSVQYGTDTEPVVVYGEGDLKFSGNVTGYGILFIDGKLELSGNFHWYGVVYVIGPQATIFNKVGTARIIGGVVFGGNNKTAVMRGTSDIWYSCETIQHIENNTNSLQNFNMLSWYE